jgi:hypothetical protein
MVNCVNLCMKQVNIIMLISFLVDLVRADCGQSGLVPAGCLSSQRKTKCFKVGLAPSYSRHVILIRKEKYIRQAVFLFLGLYTHSEDFQAKVGMFIYDKRTSIDKHVYWFTNDKRWILVLESMSDTITAHQIYAYVFI